MKNLLIIIFLFIAVPGIAQNDEILSVQEYFENLQLVTSAAIHYYEIGEYDNSLEMANCLIQVSFDEPKKLGLKIIGFVACKRKDKDLLREVRSVLISSDDYQDVLDAVDIAAINQGMLDPSHASKKVRDSLAISLKE